MSGSYNSSAGFTLIELLISMSLFALLSVCLYAGLRFGIAAWDRNSVHTVRTNEIVRAQALLRSQIEHAYPLFVSEDVTRGHVAFEGTPDRVTLLAPARDTVGGAGNAQLTFASIASNNRVDLKMTAHHELAADQRRAMQLTLQRALKSLRFAYFGSTSPQEPAHWQDQWISQSRLPQLVRISATFDTDDGRSWPTLVVAPEITADAGCILDVLTSYCQGR